MNTYQGGGISQGKIIPIKRHFASLIFRILTNETFSENFKLSLWEFDYGLFTKLPRMIVAYDFPPNSFKLKRGTSLDKLSILTWNHLSYWVKMFLVN